ncbi:MAG: hypothetical protein NZ480_06190 [Bdellovibrionaceae bacterium]|nr:hypothetical protein [Pseudobdellovibrionaceae bacterium]
MKTLLYSCLVIVTITLAGQSWASQFEEGAAYFFYHLEMKDKKSFTAINTVIHAVESVQEDQVIYHELVIIDDNSENGYKNGIHLGVRIYDAEALREHQDIRKKFSQCESLGGSIDQMIIQVEGVEQTIDVCFLSGESVNKLLPEQKEDGSLIKLLGISDQVPTGVALVLLETADRTMVLITYLGKKKISVDEKK